jgi:hypothetical protein
MIRDRPTTAAAAPPKVQEAESAILLLIRLTNYWSTRGMQGRSHPLRISSTAVPDGNGPPGGMLWMLRQTAWGAVAAAAVAMAIFACWTDGGQQRGAAVWSYFNAKADKEARHPFDAEIATRQLAQAVRNLTDDRDQLVKRVAAVEHDLDDMTGSIKKQIDEAKAANVAPPWPIDAPPVPMTPADVAAMVKPVTPPPSKAAAPSMTDRTPATLTPIAYGADVGNGISIKALQTRWTSLRFAHPEVFDGLQPLASPRENVRTSRAELHLVVGPYPSADAAMQLCDQLVPFRITCQPTMFDGSHLALQ